VNLWLGREHVWCSLPVYHCPLEIWVNRNCQIGVHTQALVRGGGHVAQCAVAGDANENCDCHCNARRFQQQVVVVVRVVQNCVAALHVASKWGHCSVVQLLLDHGADIDCRTGVSKHLLTTRSINYTGLARKSRATLSVLPCHF